MCHLTPPTGVPLGPPPPHGPAYCSTFSAPSGPPSTLSPGPPRTWLRPAAPCPAYLLSRPRLVFSSRLQSRLCLPARTLLRPTTPQAISCGSACSYSHSVPGPLVPPRPMSPLPPPPSPLHVAPPHVTHATVAAHTSLRQRRPRYTSVRCTLSRPRSRVGSRAEDMWATLRGLGVPHARLLGGAQGLHTSPVSYGKNLLKKFASKTK